MDALGVIISMIIIWSFGYPEKAGSWLGLIIGNAAKEYKKIINR